MGLETAMGEISPSRQGSIFNLGRSTAVTVVEVGTQNQEEILYVGDILLQSPR